jgi:hypothetical protein
MDVLIFHVISWPTLGCALFVYGFAPGALLRLIVLFYPRDHPRRRELIGELYAYPRIMRPFWVAEQLETALFEGLHGRLAAWRARRPASPHGPDSLSHADAEAAWHAVTAVMAGTPHVRISRDGGRTYPARDACPLPAVPPVQPATVAVYDPPTGTGRMLALDLDLGRGDVDRQADELGQLLERLGAWCVADTSPSGGRHLYVLFAAPLPWRELRDVARAVSLRFPAVDPAPMCSLGGQISPPGSRHKSGGWCVLSTSLEDARAAVEHPNGPKVWGALLVEFAAELRKV